MILIIRGHIRKSFEDKHLYNFIERLYNINSDIEIYIHTWNIFSNNISWRNIDIDNTIVTEEVINTYFEKYSKYIKHIIIDNDNQIKLNGNLEGKINNGKTPIIGWKNYWYGKYKIIDYLYNTNIDIDKNKIIINFRFDLFNNSNNFNVNLINNFIKNNINKIFIKNIFMFENENRCGIDNIYIGNIETMKKLIDYFHFHLDDILKLNNNVLNQEYLVYRINSQIFSL